MQGNYLSSTYFKEYLKLTHCTDSLPQGNLYLYNLADCSEKGFSVLIHEE